MSRMVSRFDFQKAVNETKTEYRARGFRSWNRFAFMLFGKQSCQDSLYGNEAGLASQGNTVYHSGGNPGHGSIISYANKHHSHELFKKLFEWMMSKYQFLAPEHNFRFRNALYGIDTTVIDSFLSLFDRAKFRTMRGAIKLYAKLNHSGNLSTFAVVTSGKVNEQKVVP